MANEAKQVISGLVDELEANRAMFEALCIACRENHLERIVPDGHWTVAEHIAHVASYDGLAIQHLRAPEAAEASDPTGPDADAWNEAQVARRAGRTPEMLLDEMEALRERSLPLVHSLTTTGLGREIFFPGDSRRTPATIPLRLWLDRWSKHDMIHARAILSALPEIGASPDFQSWLADDPLLEALEREEGGPR